jgi:WhiB family redox-sensing transcriptional regulator
VDELTLLAPDLSLADMPAPGSWSRRARCRDVSSVVFFVSRGESVSQARAICGRCPVKAECLEYALAFPHLLGVWAGTTVEQRDASRARLQDAQPPSPATKRGNAARGTLCRFLEELSCHPGRWARVAHYAGAGSSQSVASMLRTGRHARPDGSWEFEGRRCPTGGSDLYARRLDAVAELQAASA